VAEVLAPSVNFEARSIEPDHHREIDTLNTQLQLDLSYGVTERLSLAALLPLVNAKAHEHFDDAGTPQEHFTRSDGTTGFGDVQVGLRYALLVKPRDLLEVGVRVKLPTGAYRLRDGEGAIGEPT